MSQMFNKTEAALLELNDAVESSLEEIRHWNESNIYDNPELQSEYDGKEKAYLHIKDMINEILRRDK